MAAVDGSGALVFFVFLSSRGTLMSPDLARERRPFGNAIVEERLDVLGVGAIVP